MSIITTNWNEISTPATSIWLEQEDPSTGNPNTFDSFTYTFDSLLLAFDEFGLVPTVWNEISNPTTTIWVENL